MNPSRFVYQPLQHSLAEGHYPLMEHFYTLQGEGAWAGHSAYFLRLGGCDVGCVWCDVKESWDPNVHPAVAVEDMVELAAQHPGRLAVVTGGEPAMYDLSALTQGLKAQGFRTHIETSGAHPLTGDWDWVCFSPKKFKAALPEVAALAHELKVIVYHKSDLAFAEEHARQVGPDCQLFLQVEWDRREAMTPWVLDYIRQNPQWRLSLQTHKYLQIP